MKFHFGLFNCMLATLIFFSSCNVARYYQKKTGKVYSKLDTEYWIEEMDSSTIQWRKVGKGDVDLLLVHGFGPMTELQWKDIVRELNQDFILYIPDLLHFGESTSDTKIYDPNFVARQLFTSFSRKVETPFYIAGVSYGGLISSLIAHEHPENVSGLILIDALSKYLNVEHTDSIAHAMGFSHINEILVPSDGNSLSALFQITFARPKKYPDFLLDRPAKELYGNQKEEKIELLEYLEKNQAAIKEQDFSFKGRTKVIWGQKDILIPVANAYSLMTTYPHASLKILPDAGHVANMDSPKEVADIIRNFIYAK